VLFATPALRAVLLISAGRAAKEKSSNTAFVVEDSAAATNNWMSAWHYH